MFKKACNFGSGDLCLLTAALPVLKVEPMIPVMTCSTDDPLNQAILVLTLHCAVTFTFVSSKSTAAETKQVQAILLTFFLSA